MGGNGFRQLRVWQCAKELAVYVYTVTTVGKFSRDFGLRDQIRRAAVSIPSNIAEGDERYTDRDAVRFLYMAKGSAAEVLTQAIIAHEIGYLDAESFAALESRCMEVAKMLSRLIGARSKTFSPSPLAFGQESTE
jgi:four helix bundle protein